MAPFKRIYWTQWVCYGLVLISQVNGQPLSICDELTLLNTTIDRLQNSLQSDTLDLIFILDISGSISQSSFTEMVKFMEDFLLFASVESKLYIRPNTTRTAILIFDEDSKFHAVDIENTEKITGCEFMQLIAGLNYNDENRGTWIKNAAEKATDVFQDWARERHVEKQVMFVMTDGEFQDTESDLRLAYKKLRGHDLEVFSVGVGEFLNDQEEVDNLKKLASAEGDAACIATWRTALIPGRDSFKPESPVWVAVAPGSHESCVAMTGSCSDKSECACNVAWPRYGCVCAEGHYMDTSTDACAPCPDGTCKDVIGNDISMCMACHDSDDDGHLLLIIALSAAAMLLLLALLLLLCLTRCGCIHLACIKTQRGHIVEDPAVLPPPYSPTPQAPVRNLSVATSHGYEIPTPSSLLTPPPLPPRPPHPPDTGHEKAQNIANMRYSVGEENDEEGQRYLSLICRDKQIDDFGIYQPLTRSLLTTPSFSLDASEAEAVMNVVIGGKPGTEFKASGENFCVKTLDNNDHMVAETKPKTRLPTITRQMWAMKSDSFLLVAVGPSRESSAMREFLTDFAKTATDFPSRFGNCS